MYKIFIIIFYLPTYIDDNIIIVCYLLKLQSFITFFRTMDSTARMAHYATKPILTNKDETREMMAIWPDVVRDITDPEVFDIPDISKWMAKVSVYNIHNIYNIKTKCKATSQI